VCSAGPVGAGCIFGGGGFGWLGPTTSGGGGGGPTQLPRPRRGPPEGRCCRNVVLWNVLQAQDADQRPRRVWPSSRATIQKPAPSLGGNRGTRSRVVRAGLATPCSRLAYRTLACVEQDRSVEAFAEMKVQFSVCVLRLVRQLWRRCLRRSSSIALRVARVRHDSALRHPDVWLRIERPQRRARLFADAPNESVLKCGATPRPARLATANRCCSQRTLPTRPGSQRQGAAQSVPVS